MRSQDARHAELGSTSGGFRTLGIEQIVERLSTESLRDRGSESPMVMREQGIHAIEHLAAG